MFERNVIIGNNLEDARLRLGLASRNASIERAIDLAECVAKRTGAEMARGRAQEMPKTAIEALRAQPIVNALAAVVAMGKSNCNSSRKDSEKNHLYPFT